VAEEISPHDLRVMFVMGGCGGRQASRESWIVAQAGAKESESSFNLGGISPRRQKTIRAPLRRVPTAGSIDRHSNPTRVMTLNSKLTKLLNEQINNEMSSSYVYLAMAAWFEQTPYSRALPSGCSPRAARRPCMR
jgi:hypothetical protein